MESWLGSQLEPFQLNDPDIIEYVLSIVEDEEEEIDAIIESCQEFLEASMVRRMIILFDQSY